ncbi:hypothetical protein O181_133137 [Austropuccinia psidii MF-1]|uniref:Uncharacterized protein n=1 Tax=Austropuccinia psidii MF-1 TaxID=1389203 RepID=A0A9Q3QEA3_9BASI|nr:hypothetical protein [Austropuccinia psidii MF-1]
MGKERVQKLTDVSPPFKQLLGTISIKAIKIIEDQFQKLKHQPNLQPCSKTLTNGMGIPCSHEIEKLLNTKGYIGSEDFHPQWNLLYNPLEDHDSNSQWNLKQQMEKIEKEVDEHEIPLQKKLIKQIQELLSFQYTTIKLCHPEKALISRGRPSLKRKRVKSTKRLPSKFEIEQDILNHHKRFLKKMHRATIGPNTQFMRGKKFYLMQKEASQDDKTTTKRKENY